ncbi:MAG: transmembrane 220 family protein [Saprospiraceae bacterium]
MKLLHAALSLLFLLFAAFQYNDPDPIQWMLLYGGVAAHFALAAAGRMNRPAVWLWLIVALVWAADLLPDFLQWVRMGEPSIVASMQAETPYVEIAREFFGLLIAAAGCGWLLWETRTPANAIL